MAAATAARAARRLHLRVGGAVQGVGFRPFVYRLATELGVGGWIANDARGVVMEVEGAEETLRRFLERLPTELPPRAAIHDMATVWEEARGECAFTIRGSDAGGVKQALVLPDLAPCDACLAEVRDPANRRHGYPFTNCTDCGPRFSIIRDLPYDRPATTMAAFRMCPACAAEYADPRDRRFHAQPNACPVCGPRLALWAPDGRVLQRDPEAALCAAADAVRAGRILALKGVGGFHLVVDAADEGAVRRLRERKGRLAKPFALMARDLEQARRLCDADAAEEALLCSQETPIVLLRRREGDDGVAPSVAPGVPRLGVMLPGTPLHHLLLQRLDGPVVATSGNRSEEPICTDEAEAVARLGGIADLLLVHDRPVQRHVDDSVAWVLRGAPQLLRRARGYAPLPLRAAAELPPLLAAGGHLKNTLAVARGGQVVLSQHIGDLDAPEALDALERVAADLLRLYEIRPTAVAHDLHPDYASTRFAERLAAELGVPRVGVQHHHAHLAACLLENGAEGEALGIVWDGTGYGGDGTIWGGELLLGSAAAAARFARFHPFRLPGGDAAAREPRRVALALLWELLGEEALEREELPAVRALAPRERALLGSMIRLGVRSPWTTSAGRLFDGVASLLGLRHASRYEGDAAVALEAAADPAERGSYPFPLTPAAEAGGARSLDWRPLLAALLADVRRGVATPTAAARFHNALVDGMVAAAREAGCERVALCGGCFHNRLLTERGAEALERAGFQVLLHRQVPAGDGGLSLGQIAVAAARLRADP